MNHILLVSASILAIAALAGVARRVFGLSLCPICFGVAGTWSWMLVARYLGLAVETTMLPILLGGSAVGAAYLLEKKLAPGRSAVLWKTLSIPLGFVAAQGLMQFNWLVVGVALSALVLLSALFLGSSSEVGADSAAVEELKRRMKDCC